MAGNKTITSKKIVTGSLKKPKGRFFRSSGNSRVNEQETEKMPMWEAFAPVRICDIGGWTDVRPSIEALPYGGATINIAITPLDNGEPSYVVARRFSSGFSDTAKGPGLSNYSPHDVGGLGTSAALNVALCAVATAPEHNGNLTRRWRMRIAEMAFRMGNDIWNILGGKQDEYAAAIGGINLFRWLRHDKVRVEPVEVAQGFTSLIEEQVVLFDTGKARLSSRIHRHVWGNMKHSLPIMKKLVALAHRTKRVMERGDIEEFGAILRESCMLQFALHRSIADPRIRQGLDALDRAKVMMGGRPCGAGGGGAVMFLIKEGMVEEAISILEGLGYGTIIPWQCDFKGLQVRRI
jgi:D-glycero-alpha-D-manno-heptose-7-phosphate kinase